MASLLMRCGCTLTFDETLTAAPICPAHGNQPVVRVIGMPKPRIRGAAKGPLVETIDLGAFTGTLSKD
jgi:hypothetical protein